MAALSVRSDNSFWELETGSERSERTGNFLPVCVQQRRPAILANTLRCRPGVVGGKGDHDSIEPCCRQIGGPDPSVGAVEAHGRGERDPDAVEYGGDRPADDAEAGKALSDIVQQRGRMRIVIAWKGGGDSRCDREGMSLVGDVLLPEELGAGCVEVLMNQLLLPRSEALRGHIAKKPSNQVPGMPRCAAQATDLQSTQRVEVGRNSMRASPIGLAQTSQIPYVPSSILASACSMSSR